MSDITGQRNTWRFGFSARVVADAAADQEEYHAARVIFWKNEHAKAVADLENATVTIQRYQQTGGERVVAAVDQRASDRVVECEYKIRDHQKKAAEFHRWYVALAANGSIQMSLDVDDVHYYGIGDPLPDSPED